MSLLAWQQATYYRLNLFLPELISCSFTFVRPPHAKVTMSTTSRTDTRLWMEEPVSPNWGGYKIRGRKIYAYQSISHLEISMPIQQEKTECWGALYWCAEHLSTSMAIFNIATLQARYSKHSSPRQALQPSEGARVINFIRPRKIRQTRKGRFRKSPTAKGWDWATPKSMWRKYANATATEIPPQTAVSHENEFCSLVRLLS